MPECPGQQKGVTQNRLKYEVRNPKVVCFLIPYFKHLPVCCSFFLWTLLGSNQRPTDYESVALTD